MKRECTQSMAFTSSHMQVELANMNRLFFRPEQSGMTKTDAAAATLSGINPDVALESYHMNITTLKGYESFKQSLLGQRGTSRVDLVLSCVDNYEARMTINEVKSKTLPALFDTTELPQVGHCGGRIDVPLRASSLSLLPLHEGLEFSFS